MINMYPTKSMENYVNEINRLFPKNPLNVVPDLPVLLDQPNTYHLPSFQPSMANHSSSSADSISPEYPDHRLESSFLNRRQRPIVGRKILGSTESTPNQNVVTPDIPVPRSFEKEFDTNAFWTPEDVNLYSTTPKNYQNYSPYELFPENKDYGLQTPMKTNPKSPSFMPSPSNASPSSSSYSPTSRIQATPPRYQSVPMFVPNFGRSPPMMPSTSNQDVSSKMCTFCRKNGETPVVYMTHMVRGKVGNRSVVTCPILRSHVCSTCGESGDNAHTITYCPVLRSGNNGAPLQSTTITLKNTRIKSNGRRRF